MEYVAAYIFFCLIVAWIGSSKTLGFGSTFLLSILLTPVTGFVILLFYPSRSHRDNRLKEQKRQTELLQNISSTKLSTADEIGKLKRLYDDGVLAKEEYEAQKNKLLQQ